MRREEVDLGDERVGDAAAAEAAGPAHDQHHAEPAVGQRRLGARERQPVVGREDHERVVGESGRRARPAPRRRPGRASARSPCRPPCRAASRACRGGCARRQRVERVAHRGRLEEVAVGLEEADRQEERLRSAARAGAPTAAGATGRDLRGRRSRRPGRSRCRPGPRDVLLADQRRRVAGVAQRVDEVVVVVGEPVAAVRQARASRCVWLYCAGQQARRGCPSRPARRRTPGGTAAPGRRGAGCSASGPGGRTAGCSARCRANGGRRCSEAKSRSIVL